jgi:hypothetical protein
LIFLRGLRVKALSLQRFLRILVFHVKLNRPLSKENTMQNRSGCLGGLLKLFLLDVVFDWLQHRFGFGRGLSCGGCGCGFVLLIIFICLALSVLTGTNWTQIRF